MINQQHLPLLFMLCGLVKLFCETLVLIGVLFVESIGAKFGIKCFFFTLLK